MSMPDEKRIVDSVALDGVKISVARPDCADFAGYIVTAPEDIGIGNSVPVVTCAKCGGPIMRLSKRELPMGDVEYTAYCHGETETTVIRRSDMNAGPINIFGGVAFSRRLPEIAA